MFILQSKVFVTSIAQRKYPLVLANWNGLMENLKFSTSVAQAQPEVA